jgi:hypothetical protein
MTRADWITFTKTVVALALIAYLSFWNVESARAGSWALGHRRLWTKPKKWQLITFCILWCFIIIGFVILVRTRQ